jgi:hypothetical protein
MPDDRPRIRVGPLGDPAQVGADGDVRATERRAAGLLALGAIQPRITRARAAALAGAGLAAVVVEDLHFAKEGGRETLEAPLDAGLLGRVQSAPSGPERPRATPLVPPACRPLGYSRSSRRIAAAMSIRPKP